MYKTESENKVWFEGSNEINCSIDQVDAALNDIGQYFVNIVRQMPGMIRVDLVDQGDDSVLIKTNEGLLKRTNIFKKREKNRIIVEFEEVYQAGRAVTTHAHFLDEFEGNDTVVKHRKVISDLSSPGFIGFFYRFFGSNSMGKAFLKAHKKYLEKENRRT